MSELEAGGAPAPAAAPTIDVTPPPAGLPEPAKEPEQQPSLDDTLNAAWDKAQTGVERGEDGKFVGKDKPDAPLETKPEDSAVQPPAEKVEPAPPAIDPPQSWTAEARASWAKLPPEAQNYILQREGEAHKAISSYGERLKSYEPIDKVITHYKGDLDRRGIDPARAISALFDAQRRLDANPVDGLVSIGLSYGIDLRPLLNGEQGSLPSPDPRVGQVEQRVNQLMQTLEQQRQQQEANQLAEIDALVTNFKSKDHPHFDAVEAHMLGLIPIMRQQHPGLSHQEVLQKAYDEAVWANPKTRELVLAEKQKADEERRKADEEKKQEELKARAEQAAKAAKLNVRSGTAHPTPKTMDDTLAEIARRHYG